MPASRFAVIALLPSLAGSVGAACTSGDDAPRGFGVAAMGGSAGTKSAVGGAGAGVGGKRSSSAGAGSPGLRGAAGEAGEGGGNGGQVGAASGGGGGTGNENAAGRASDDNSAGAGGEGGGLDGDAVSLVVKTPLDRAISEQLSAIVGPDVEFPNIEAHPLSGFYIGAADIDVKNRTIELDYHPTAPTTFPDASFNGYVLTFAPSTGAPIARLSIAAGTSLELRAAKLTLSHADVLIDVSGLTVGAGSKLVVAVGF